MRSKKLIPVVGLMLLVAAALAAGASQFGSVGAPTGGIVQSPNADKGVHPAIPVVPAAPALPQADAPVAFEDNFAQNSLANWQPLASAQGTWVVSNGRLQQRGDANGDFSDNHAVLVVTKSNFANGSILAEAYSQKGSVLGLAFRGSDAGYYRLDLYRNASNSSAKAELYKVTASGEHLIGSAPASVYAGMPIYQWQLVRVDALGSQINVSVNGTQILSVTDASFSSGWAGVSAAADMSAQFGSVRIQSAGAGR